MSAERAGVQPDVAMGQNGEVIQYDAPEYELQYDAPEYEPQYGAPPYNGPADLEIERCGEVPLDGQYKKLYILGVYRGERESLVGRWVVSRGTCNCTIALFTVMVRALEPEQMCGTKSDLTCILLWYR